MQEKFVGTQHAVPLPYVLAQYLCSVSRPTRSLPNQDKQSPCD
jgi:hypothetical protein